MEHFIRARDTTEHGTSGPQEQVSLLTCLPILFGQSSHTPVGPEGEEVPHMQASSQRLLGLGCSGEEVAALPAELGVRFWFEDGKDSLMETQLPS